MRSVYSPKGNTSDPISLLLCLFVRICDVCHQHVIVRANVASTYCRILTTEMLRRDGHFLVAQYSRLSSAVLHTKTISLAGSTYG